MKTNKNKEVVAIGLLVSRSSRLCGLHVEVLSHDRGYNSVVDCLSSIQEGPGFHPSRREQVLQRANAIAQIPVPWLGGVRLWGL